MLSPVCNRKDTFLNFVPLKMRRVDKTRPVAAPLVKRVLFFPPIAQRLDVRFIVSKLQRSGRRLFEEVQVYGQPVLVRTVPQL